MKDKTPLHISIPVIKDCKNPDSWAYTCDYCNRCGRWDDTKKNKADGSK